MDSISETVHQTIISGMRDSLQEMIRDECDAHECSEAELPKENRVFLNGARRLVERIEHAEGVEHVRILY